MGIRESLNESKKLGIGVGGAILVVALALLGYQLYGGSSGVGTPPKTAFYTDDNGKTFFEDDVLKVSPFERNGKQAYRADVFQCSDGKRFVGFIYRHNDSGRQQVEQYIANKTMNKDKGGSLLGAIESACMEFKRAGAGDRAWRPNDSAAIDSLRAAVKCPSGGPATLVNAE
jgi:hypothetical protein